MAKRDRRQGTCYVCGREGIVERQYGMCKACSAYASFSRSNRVLSFESCGDDWPEHEHDDIDSGLSVVDSDVQYHGSNVE